MDKVSLCRFGAPPPGQAAPSLKKIKRDRRFLPAFPPWRYGRIFERERLQGSVERLCIGADERQTDLLLTLSRIMPEPLGLLYVLHTPVHEKHEAGRYMSPLVSRKEAAAFLEAHAAFLECDGRHDFWIGHLDDNGRLAPPLVFDQHNLIYAYGPLDRYEAVLREGGFVEGAVKIPAPHNHHYHHEFNDLIDAMHTYWAWRRVPLQPSDER